MDSRDIHDASGINPVHKPLVNKEIEKEGKGLGRDRITIQSSGDKKEQKLIDKTIKEPSQGTPALKLEEANEILKNYEFGTSGIEEKLVKSALNTVYDALGTGKLGLKDIQLFSKDSIERLLNKSQDDKNINGLLTSGKLLKDIVNERDYRSHIQKFQVENVSPEILKYFLNELYSLEGSDIISNTSDQEKMLNVYALERYRKYEAIVVSQLLEATLSAH